MELKASIKIFENFKCDYPENTIKKVEEGLKKICLNPIYNQKEIISNGFYNYYGELLIEELGFLTCGKGTSSILAKASAYAEMAERISSGFFVFHTITDNFEEYAKILDGVVKRKFLRGFVQNQKDEQISYNLINKYIESNITNKEFELLKSQGLFDVNVDSYSFINQEYEKLPVRFVEVTSGSTGLAAGNTIEEALVQGSCEIFERYTAYKILTEKIPCSTIAIDSIKNEKVQYYTNLYKSMNVDVKIKDFSLNKDLPVICVIFTNNNIKNDDNKFKKDLYYKMLDIGSHPDLNQAIIRCLVERLQAVTKEEFMFREKSDVLYNFWTKILDKKYNKAEGISKDFFIDYEACGDISFLETGDDILFNDLKSVKNKDCLDDCKILIDICNKNSWDLQAIDYTHKILNFPALRVVIPPLSTSHDSYILEALKIEDFIDRFNYLYGVKDFYYYLTDDSWINNKEKTEELVANLEDFLSKNLTSYRFLIRQMHFIYPVNLFHILAFSNLSLENYLDTLKFLEILIRLNDKPSFYTPYFNTILNPGYNPVLFSGFINLIKNGLEKNNPQNFSFNSNPFRPKGVIKESKVFYEKLLSTINNSYF